MTYLIPWVPKKTSPSNPPHRTKCAEIGTRGWFLGNPSVLPPSIDEPPPSPASGSKTERPPPPTHPPTLDSPNGIHVPAEGNIEMGGLHRRSRRGRGPPRGGTIARGGRGGREHKLRGWTGGKTEDGSVSKSHATGVKCDRVSIPRKKLFKPKSIFERKLLLASSGFLGRGFSSYERLATLG